MPVKNFLKKKLIECRPYTISASIYNDMMSDVDYESWADYIADMIEYENLQPDSICDISCGTGTLLHTFQHYYTGLSGYDSSPEMLSVLHETFPDIPAELADMNSLPEGLKADLYLNIHDALNYYHRKEEIIRHLTKMSRNLQNGASYFFDFALPPLIEKYFSSTKEEGENAEGMHFLRENTWDPSSKTCETRIYISKAEDRNTIYLETHLQKIYTLGEIQEMCENVQGVQFKYYKEFSFDEADDKTERLFVVMSYDPFC